MHAEAAGRLLPIEDFEPSLAYLLALVRLEFAWRLLMLPARSSAPRHTNAFLTAVG